MKTLTIREWYLGTYPEDDLGYLLSPTANFLQLKDVLENGDDVYDFLGVGDSVVRERVFDKAARVFGVPYDFLYEQWLTGGRIRRAEYVRNVLGVVA